MERRTNPQPNLRPGQLSQKQKQKLAMQLMLDGHGTSAVCEKLGISQPTFWRWKNSAAWQEALWSAVRGEQQDGEIHMRTLVPQATRVAQALLVTGSDQVKLGASRLVFETVANLVAREEQQALLSQLEQQLDEIRATVASNGAAGQLTPGNSQVLDAEIVAHSHDLSHTEQQQEAKAE
ncbi:helix-turn-helix domain-containing protein [Synechococcus sp. LA31]|uniref:helix-turn-helix domain-containing protein n=1 Tax=Synechococcus sp. LA31 TaxID=2741953 RepID=UPI001BDBD3F8|nr:helix-turn-helix domain-containing protein [Synechococcus sp. LA31]QVV66538.1 helix-turn-helix domain-containing protein [Synechococcus sp. LA31]